MQIETWETVSGEKRIDIAIEPRLFCTLTGEEACELRRKVNQALDAILCPVPDEEGEDVHTAHA